MRNNLLENSLDESILEDKRDLEQYYCVEISIMAGLIYQFRIWQKETMFMTILVKENSDFLSYIDENSRHSMKYYSSDFFYPYQELVTEIRDIRYQERGRLKGHYLVSLEILEEAEKTKIQNLFYTNDYGMLQLRTLN